MQRLKLFLNLLRVDQYTKNFFIFLPAFFGSKLLEDHNLITLCLTFLAFSLIASSIYIINDCLDIKQDRLHPLKKMRPLTAGKISTKSALVIMTVLAVTGLTIARLINLEVFLLLGCYFLLMLAYSFKLKQIALIDVFIIALGFIIRIVIGGAAVSVFVSSWLIITTFLLALFLALSKRRDDLIFFKETGVKVRKAVNGYNLPFLDVAIIITASITLISYLMYTFSTQVLERFHSDNIYITGIFVVLGILRYLQHVYILKKSASPSSILLHDRLLQLIILLWLLTFALIIYN